MNLPLTRHVRTRAKVLCFIGLVALCGCDRRRIDVTPATVGWGQVVFYLDDPDRDPNRQVIFKPIVKQQDNKVYVTVNGEQYSSWNESDSIAISVLNVQIRTPRSGWIPYQGELPMGGSANINSMAVWTLEYEYSIPVPYQSVVALRFELAGLSAVLHKGLDDPASTQPPRNEQIGEGSTSNPSQYAP